jgi:hypothetical protein
MQANAMRKLVHPSCDVENMLGYAESFGQAAQSARLLFFLADAFGLAKHGARILAQNLGEQLHGPERHILLTQFDQGKVLLWQTRALRQFVLSEAALRPRDPQILPKNELQLDGDTVGRGFLRRCAGRAG